MKLVWETYENDSLQRAKILGGWLVKTFEDASHERDDRMMDGWDWRVSMCFVPDEEHLWRIEE